MARIDFVTGNARLYLPEVEALAAVPDRLDDVLSGVRESRLSEHAEDAPSASRLIGDMIGYARHDREALFRMAWMTDPEIAAWDADADSDREVWEARSAPRLIAWLTEALSESVEVLKELPDASWGRPGLFPEGRRSIRQRVRASVAYHDAQINRIRTLLEPDRNDG